MRPGRRPPQDPIEQEARAQLREPTVQAPAPTPQPAPAKPRPERRPERWR